MITNKQELLDFFMRSRKELIKNNNNHITVRKYLLTKDDITEIADDIYIKLHKLKKVKPADEKYYLNYFYLMFNNLYKDMYNEKVKYYNIKVNKKDTVTHTIDNYIIPVEENAISLSNKYNKVLNKIEDPKTLLIISFLENYFNEEQVENILYYSTLDTKEDNKIYLKNKCINIIKIVINTIDLTSEELKTLLNNKYNKTFSKNN